MTADHGPLPELAAPGVEVWAGEIRDEPFGYPVTMSVERFRGHVVALRSDVVEFDGGKATRDVVEHPGAVGIIAVDEARRVLLIRQYRHPVGMMLFEPPAGLLDVPGEPPLETAKRELLEEAGLEAREWNPLVSMYNTPGGSDERLTIFLATRLSRAPGGRTLTGEAEEASMPEVWVPVDEAVELVLLGRLSNPTAVAGILAFAAL